MALPAPEVEAAIRRRVAEQLAADEALRTAAVQQAVGGIAAGDSSGLARQAIAAAAAATGPRASGRGGSLASYAGANDARTATFIPKLEAAGALSLGQQGQVLDWRRAMNKREDEQIALRDYMEALADMPQVGSGGGGGGGGRRSSGGQPAPVPSAAPRRSGVSSTLDRLLAEIRGGATPAPTRRTPSTSTPTRPRAPTRRPTRTSTTRYS